MRLAVLVVAPVIGLACALLGAPPARAQGIAALVETTSGPVAVDQVTHRAYVPMRDGTLAVLDGTAIVARYPIALNPLSMVIDSTHHRMYAALSRDQGRAIELTTGRLMNDISGAGTLFVVNERTQTLYGLDAFVGSEIKVVDGTTSSVRGSIALPAVGCHMALNQDSNQLYVVHCNDRMPGASVVDLDTSKVTFVPIPEHMPREVAVNPATNRAYVVNGDGGTMITVIEGATRQSRSLKVGIPLANSIARVAVNPVSNRIYAQIGPELLVIDGATESVVARVKDVNGLMRVDPAANRLYILVGPGPTSLVTLDADGGVVSRIPLPVREISLDLDVAMRRLYTAGPGGLVIDTTATPGPPMNNYQGLWWDAAEPGWGLNIAQQGDVWSVAWYTYDEQGNPAWFFMSRGTRTQGEAFSGALYRMTAGSSFQSDPFNSSSVVPVQVGTLSFSFSDASNGTMVAIVNGTRISKPITRFQLAAAALNCETWITPTADNTTDLWWKAPGGSESGWGLFLTEQGDTLFGVWFTYVDSLPTWFTATMKRDPAITGTRGYKGDLYRTSGPPHNAPAWDASRVRPVPSGSMSVVFTDYDQATFSFTLGGVSGQRKMTRTRFGVLASWCKR